MEINYLMYLSYNEQSPKIDMKKTQLIISSNKKSANKSQDPTKEAKSYISRPRSPFKTKTNGNCLRIMGMKAPVKTPKGHEFTFEQTPKSM